MYNHFTSTIGPIGATVDDLILGTKISFDPKVHLIDPYCSPSPWRDQDFIEVSTKPKKQIKIGVIEESPLFPCSESVKRTMKLAQKALEDMGYEVV